MNELLGELLPLANAVWRRRWVALGVAAAICMLCWLALLVIPSRFEAKARVFVDVRTALKPVLKGIAVDEEVESEVSLVREALLSYPQMEGVARANGMLNSRRSVEDVVSELQQKIDVVAERGANEGAQSRDSVVYAISYRDPSATRSVAVVSSLLNGFVKDTQAGNRSGSSQAQMFLSNQIAEYETRLTAAEGRLAEFKKRNEGMIPGDRGDYFTRLAKELSDQQEAQTNLAIAMSRREALHRQLAATKPFLSGTSGGGGNGNGASADISTRLQDDEAKLADLLTRYTEKHPEVIALQATVRDLRAQQKKELAELERGGVGTGSIRSLSANPVYQSIQVQLNQVEVELASIQGAISQHTGEIQNLRKFVNSAPEVEQEYSRLNRDYGVTKAQYEALVQRLEQARVSESAAASGSVRFEVIDPPRAASRPVWPNRPLLALAGLVVGLLLGVGVAVAMHLATPTFNSLAELGSLGVPVAGLISQQHDQTARNAMARDTRKAGYALAGLVAASLVMAVIGDPVARLIRVVFTAGGSP